MFMPWAQSTTMQSYVHLLIKDCVVALHCCKRACIGLLRPQEHKHQGHAGV